MEYVLITGGSSGIGFALAKKFAAEHYGIVLAASNQKKLAAAKESLEQEFGARVYLYQLDLAKLGAAERLYQAVRADGIKISVLVNNAGCGVIGPAEEIHMKKEEEMLLLNMVTPVELTKLFLKDMYQAKSGAILNVSSTGAFQPGPYTASYYASKEFLFSYSQAVRFEAARHGVKVCVVCPGTTDTGFFERAGRKTPAHAMSPEKVAAYAYQRLKRNKAVSIPGISFRLMKLCPIKIKTLVIARVKAKK